MTDTEKPVGHFSDTGRTLDGENEIVLTSVGVDIGSSTSHLVFSRIVMEQIGNRYRVTERRILHESDVLLTPYTQDDAIDADRLGEFIDQQYARAGLAPDAIDTGALILTGVAVRRSNARSIGDLFASQAGKFVSVSAGDGLETTLVAFGSGAAARSMRDSVRVMNVDVGGGTSKIALCENGQISALTAIDVGARIVCFDADDRVTHLEEAGRSFAAEAGRPGLAVGDTLDVRARQAMVERMADRLFQAMGGAALDGATRALLRLDSIESPRKPDILTFSGGVSEYIYGRESRAYGDLGPQLADAVRARAERWGVELGEPAEGLRATVVGASQYTIQVSGTTIFVQPLDTLPVRNVPVVAPEFADTVEDIEPDRIASAIRQSLKRLDLEETHKAVALCFRWSGSASYRRLDQFCRGVVTGLTDILQQGVPLVLVNDGDIGGLVGLHLAENQNLPNPIVSIDGIRLREFDFIDIGALLETSGSVPVVIKSLVFPTTAALGTQDRALNS